MIGLVNFCLIYKFCQHYDENLDSKVGGFSICDALTCLLTCGLIYRKKPDDGGPTADELDFRKRFEKSMDKNNGDLGFGQVKKKKARERKGKDMSTYLSVAARNKKAANSTEIWAQEASLVVLRQLTAGNLVAQSAMPAAALSSVAWMPISTTARRSTAKCLRSKTKKLRSSKMMKRTWLGSQL